jgi:hypothetical protein
MPIAFEMLRIDSEITRLSPSRLEDEARLETILKKDIRFLGLDLMILGQQVITSFGKRVDLLAIDEQGNLVIIEIKRDRTPRDVVAQLLDYGSWVKTLKHDEILAIFSRESPTVRFEEAFANQFGSSPPETLNQAHQLVVVASELDHSTERIVAYLSTVYSVPINAVFFQYLRDGSHEYLARTWLIDPNQSDVGEAGPVKGKQEPWNGQDFYVTLGEGRYRTWDDCMKYGFISGGHGKWYSKTLAQLFPDARVFVHLPGKGYVGVGKVVEPVRAVKDFAVEIGGNAVPILGVSLQAEGMGEESDDPELSEYLVRVEWEKALPKEQAIWEKGMFANQNIVAKLRNKFTLDRLSERFGVTKLPL